jgi:hypothetical protein
MISMDYLNFLPGKKCRIPVFFGRLAKKPLKGTKKRADQLVARGG